MAKNYVEVENVEIDFSKIFKQIKLHIKAITIIIMVALLLGYAYTATRTKKYESTATMAVMYTGGENESSYGKWTFSTNIVDTFVLFISENIVLDNVAEETGYTTEHLKKCFSVENKNLILYLSYTDTDPKQAENVLNIIMDTAISIANQEDASGKPKYEMLSDGLQIFSNASSATEVSMLGLNLLISFLIGCILAYLYVFICWIKDRKYKDTASIEEDLELPVFTSVPYYSFNERKHRKR